MSVENSKKVLADLIAVTAKVIVEVKSAKGLVQEGVDLVSDAAVQAAVKDFIASISGAIDEMKNLESEDYVTLAVAALSDIQPIVDAFKA